MTPKRSSGNPFERSGGLPDSLEPSGSSPGASQNPPGTDFGVPKDRFWTPRDWFWRLQGLILDLQGQFGFLQEWFLMSFDFLDHPCTLKLWNDQDLVRFYRILMISSWIWSFWARFLGTYTSKYGAGHCGVGLRLKGLERGKKGVRSRFVTFEGISNWNPDQ